MSCLGVGGFCFKARISCTGGVVESRDAIEVTASGLSKGGWRLAMTGLVCRLRTDSVIEGDRG